MRIHYDSDYDVRQLQQRIYANLVAFDAVCREHDLRYYLWAGTMLGAVRHHGFIPWDDDIDVAMPRPDYERLMAHWKEWMDAPFEIIAPETDTAYPYPFAKVQDASTTVMERPDFSFLEGVYVDVFPIDGFPADSVEQRRHYRRWKLWRHLLFMRARNPFKHGYGPRSWFPLLIHLLLPMTFLQRRVKKYMTRYDYDHSDYVVAYDDNGIDAIFPKRVLGDAQPYEFIDRSFPGVEHSHEYLTINFGDDYMQLPPVEKRVFHRFYHVDFNRPYREVEVTELV